MRTFLYLVVPCLLFLISSVSVFAIEDPLRVSNNRFGVHILFPEEIERALDLVNSSGGEWGYVTIPIQASDRDLKKWQKFMDDCYKYKLIPIIRIATENYYFDPKVWRKPQQEDIIDFANFLNSLDWPIKNRYVVIFNEVNRADEWGGSFDPREYARLLKYAITTFKSRSQDFFIISAGLDNGAGNNSNNSIDQYSFMLRMNNEVSGIFNNVDGLASHSYPNPGFRQPPNTDTNKSIVSFRYEGELAKQMSGKDLPIFITETGWSLESTKEEKIASYFEEAFNSFWKDKNIVAVTPFLLRAGGGPFAKFSLISNNGSPNLAYRTIQNIPKTKGEPILLEVEKEQEIDPKEESLPMKNFVSSTSKSKKTIEIMDEIQAVKTILKWLINPQNLL